MGCVSCIGYMYTNRLFMSLALWWFSLNYIGKVGGGGGGEGGSEWVTPPPPPQHQSHL